MGIDFRRPRHIRGFRLGEVLVWDFTSKPLVEKTVSGSVVAFADGADDVPIKSASFGIVASGGGGTPSTPVPIVGKSSVTVFQTGKNVIDISGTDENNGYLSGKWISSINTGNNNADWHTTEYLSIKSNVEYTLSGIAYGNQPALCFYDENKDFISGIAYANRSSFTFTSPATAKYARFSIRNDFTVFILEVGSTATAYEAYKSKTPITVALGQTVYGGTLAEDGTLTITHTMVSDTWGNMSLINTYENTVRKRLTITYESTNLSTSLSNITTYLNSTSDTVHYRGFGTTAFDFYLPPNTTSDTVIQVCYELATPIVITGLDEISISTYLGDNTMWSDDGDLSITYYANAD